MATKDDIKTLRENLGITQIELATLIRSKVPAMKGPHPSTVARWESGSTEPRYEYIKVLMSLAKDAGCDGLFS